MARNILTPGQRLAVIETLRGRLSHRQGILCASLGQPQRATPC
jgi:hypothetical protein